MDGVGPGNEAIIDYSVYDAIRAGFGKVVFVIRHSFASDFQEVSPKSVSVAGSAWSMPIRSWIVWPEGFTVPEACETLGNEPCDSGGEGCRSRAFAVINADDFYGAEAFRTIAEYLRGLDGASGRYCMVAYELSRTLSENGTVSRGVCSVNAAATLREWSSIRRSNARRPGSSITVRTGMNRWAEDTPVSMNLFGFTPDYFAHSEAFFGRFCRRVPGI